MSLASVCAHPRIHATSSLDTEVITHPAESNIFPPSLAPSLPPPFFLSFFTSLSHSRLLNYITLHSWFYSWFHGKKEERIITRILDFLFFRKICNDLITDKRNTHRGEFWLKGRLKLREIIWQILIRDLGVDIETVASMVCTVLFAGIGGQITQNNIPCFRNTCIRCRNYYARIGKSKLFYALTTSWKYFMSGI